MPLANGVYCWKWWAQRGTSHGPDCTGGFGPRPCAGSSCGIPSPDRGSDSVRRRMTRRTVRLSECCWMGPDVPQSSGAPSSQCSELVDVVARQTGTTGSISSETQIVMFVRAEPRPPPLSPQAVGAGRVGSDLFSVESRAPWHLEQLSARERSPCVFVRSGRTLAAAAPWAVGALSRG